MIMLQTSVFGEGVVADLLTKWEALGFFSYLLPFLLVFALVFGILTRTQIFKENKAVNAIIALAVAFMSLQFDFVPTFFSQIFPRLGVGLAIILGVLIIIGLFAPPNSKIIDYILLGVGVLVIGVIIVQSAAGAGWESAEFWDKYFGVISVIIVLAILVFIVVGASTQPKQPDTTYYAPHWRGK
ncbi:MAG: hypothetical protein PHQ66_00655 [Candidatus Nanoarchaeia archaeon]|nr:hypothetical protein [Candidatus Nanoarchaeia archaeon]MDD5358512.1 hypothetical protein [Candidatus Nanoarchaeia archaeon]MDD5589026.1 hypothetical protein [Candidatus Nanoarchaeia archaeon]